MPPVQAFVTLSSSVLPSGFANTVLAARVFPFVCVLFRSPCAKLPNAKDRALWVEQDGGPEQRDKANDTWSGSIYGFRCFVDSDTICSIGRVHLRTGG